ncbi:MAG: copper homeostasis protein CutC [Pirellula sp.]
MLEVCVDTIEALRIAIDSGAQCIELSENLSVGGVTPSVDLIQRARRECAEPLIVLIRSRDGDFCYTDQERELMLEQAVQAIRLGADGVAIGACHEDRSLDWDFLFRAHRVVKDASLAASLVVHRVFDNTLDPTGAIERLIEYGYDRILTSGGAVRAVDSLDSLREWQAVASNRLEILPAGGVHALNAQVILRSTGCRQLHGSFTASETGKSDRMPSGTQIAKVRRILDEYLAGSCER